MYSVKPYTPEPGMNKLMRLHAQTGAIENGLVFLPAAAEWLDLYLHAFERNTEQWRTSAARL